MESGTGRVHLELPALSLAEVWEQADNAGIDVTVAEDLASWPLLPWDHPGRQRQCEGKDAYLYLESAILAAVRRKRASGTYLRVYSCPFGLHHHLTSKPSFNKGDKHTVTDMKDVAVKDYSDQPYRNTRVTNKDDREDHVVAPRLDDRSMGSHKVLADLAAKPPNYTLKDVELSKVFWDMDYCRELTDANLNRLRNDWQPEAVGTIYVSSRPNGHLAGIEGRHRTTVALEKGITHLPARIYHGLTKEQEAALYNLFNRYSPQSSLDRLKARIVAKVPLALSMTAMLSEVGLAWNFDKKGKKNQINAASTMEYAYNTWGADVLRDALHLLHDAWGANAAAFKDDTISGAVQFLARYGGYKFSMSSFNRARMIKLMQERGVAQFRAEAIHISLTFHLRRSHSFGRAMRSIYNLNMRKGQLADWPERFYNESTREQYAQRITQVSAKLTPEQRSARAVKAAQSLTPAQRSDRTRRGAAKRKGTATA